LHDGTGPSALARFDHDVLALDGVKYIIILEGINDIGGNQRKTNNVTADDLIWGFTQMVERAHAHGIKVIGATLTPYGGAGYSYPPGQQIVETLNNWIRTGGVVDGYVDFYKATQDPANPTHFAAFADSGDHLHPKDAGYKAMADSIDLNLFK
jgi:lysophospholipase L1-like esterase